MTESQKPLSRFSSDLADPVSLAAKIDSSLKSGSSLSVTLLDAVVGVNFDRIGDWTITVGISLKSDRFRQITSSLEDLGFFQATENEGASFMLWTSLLGDTQDVKGAAERTLFQALKILQAPAVSTYIR